MDINQYAATAGIPAPKNDKAPLAGRPVNSQTAENTQDFANESANSKALAAIHARAAKCGCTVHELAGGGYLVSRWNLSTFAPCLRCVGDLLRQIGGQQ